MDKPPKETAAQFAAFLDATCERDISDNYISGPRLYRAYRQWSAAHNMPFPSYNMMRFGKLRGMETKRKSIDGESMIVYYGYKFRELGVI